MMFSVPQFIDVEDKIAGPLTWRQLLWMIGMGAVLLTLFSLLDGALFIVVSIPVVLLFIALAFYRPNGFSLTSFLFYMFLFLFRPKVSVWERPVKVQPLAKPHARHDEPQHIGSRGIEQAKLAELARILDSRGKR